MNTKLKALPKKVVHKLLSPAEKFMALETSSGILLMVVTLITLIWANSPWSDTYQHIIHFPITLTIGDLTLSHGLQHWVNDALMVIFFFVVGLEIKRELILGELSSFKKAALPMIAALGGMVVPALIYASFNNGEASASGWGIPMATDIAFAVGVLSLMSRKVPFSLKIFLLALAIVDDLGAVLVIALFYTNEISSHALLASALLFSITYFLKVAGIRNFLIYILLGILIWFFVLKSGVHATVAGVLLGLMTPSRPLISFSDFGDKIHGLIDAIAPDIRKSSDHDTELSAKAKERLEELHHMLVETKSPLDRIIHSLHSWVGFGIMPVFAFCNAGVSIESGFNFISLFQNPLSLGIILGLCIGKPVGVFLFSFVAVHFKLAELPKGIRWSHIMCAGLLAGIGFTMALFIGQLAIKSDEMQTYVKLSILLASSISATLGLIALKLLPDAKHS